MTQATNDVQQREAGVRIARAQRLPSVSVNSAYGPVAYPAVVPSFGDFRTNWTVGATAQMPLFTGGRIGAQTRAAEAAAEEARYRREQAVKLAALDARDAYTAAVAAEAAWQASEGTVEQATRAYDIADVRFREGISTQTELTDARLALQNAAASRAVAARDLRVARLRVALLADLPLGGTAGTP